MSSGSRGRAGQHQFRWPLHLPPAEGGRVSWQDHVEGAKRALSVCILPVQGALPWPIAAILFSETKTYKNGSSSVSDMFGRLVPIAGLFALPLPSASSRHFKALYNFVQHRTLRGLVSQAGSRCLQKFMVS